jgi:hypothetical protein
MMSVRSEAALWLKRRINAAKAERGMSWAQIAEKVSSQGRKVSAGSLMSKQSRASFSALELIAILQALEVPVLNLPAEQHDRSSRRRTS